MTAESYEVKTLKQNSKKVYMPAPQDSCAPDLTGIETEQFANGWQESFFKHS